jgi:peptide/nickel transport system substrate-binding protein
VARAPQPRASRANRLGLGASAAAAVLALALASCTGGDQKSSAPASMDRPLFDAGRQGPAPAVPGATRGGTITMRLPCCLRARYFDPGVDYATDTSAISTSLLTRSLTQWAWDPATDSTVLVPDLATDLGRPNADYTTWTYTIREGARFEDGAPITAADVAFGIERSMDQKRFKGGPPYANEFFLDGDSYQGPYRSGTDYPGVQAHGDQLVITMSKPFPDFPFYASFPEMGPVPQYVAGDVEYWRHPVASGPYKIATFEPRKRLVLVRNAEWDPDTDPARHQYPNRFVFLMRPASPDGSFPLFVKDEHAIIDDHASHVRGTKTSISTIGAVR